MSIRPSVQAADEILGGYFPVLDHGFVSLVDYMGGDEAIEAAARVSYGAGTRRVRERRGLIRYLHRHKHTTPFEMVEMKFHCAMPIFIARQWIRHRTASVNEMSARYSILPTLFYTPEQEYMGLQSQSNRQGRESGSVNPAVYAEAVRMWRASRNVATNLYDRLNDEKVARELARIDLPLSIYTQWYWKCNLHNLLHFLTLRVDSHAQWEIRAFGQVMAGMMKRVAPLAYEAWIDYDVTGARLSGQEREAIAAALKEGRTIDDIDSELKGRELAEFSGKLEPSSRPDFELDLRSMMTAEEMQRKQEDALGSAKSGGRA